MIYALRTPDFDMELFTSPSRRLLESLSESEQILMLPGHYGKNAAGMTNRKSGAQHWLGRHVQW